MPRNWVDKSCSCFSWARSLWFLYQKHSSLRFGGERKIYEAHLILWDSHFLLSAVCKCLGNGLTSHIYVLVESGAFGAVLRSFQAFDLEGEEKSTKPTSFCEIHIFCSQRSVNALELVWQVISMYWLHVLNKIHKIWIERFILIGFVSILYHVINVRFLILPNIYINFISSWGHIVLVVSHLSYTGLLVYNF